MNKKIATTILFFGCIALANAQETSGSKPQEAKAGAAQSPSTIGDGVREVGREVKTAARKVRRAVVTRCADGRRTVKGKAGCAKHGGVSAKN